MLFSLSAREAIASISFTATAAEVDDVIGRFVAELRSLWRKAREIGGAAVIQQTFIDVSDPLFGGYDRIVPGAPAPGRRSPQRSARRSGGARRRALLDVARASQRDGIDAWFDVGRWLQGKLEIAPQAAPLYGDLAARILGARRGLSKKCLVLDLDNTLWGGVIGDDGLEGIVLGEGSAAAKPISPCSITPSSSRSEASFSPSAPRTTPRSQKRRFAITPKWFFAARISPPSRPIGTTRRKT